MKITRPTLETVILPAGQQVLSPRSGVEIRGYNDRRRVIDGGPLAD